MMARAVIAAGNETYPEADRLEGFLHPRETPRLFGHDEAQRELASALANGRAHHAWLLSGPRGIGKATLAYLAARAALARADERDLFGDGFAIASDGPTDRQVRGLSHPALFVVRRIYDMRTKRLTQSIPIDELRRLKNFLAHTVGDESRRIVIVDSADDLNANAANALLKALEEPPPRTMFLIVTSAPGQLLPTIRSRCRTLPMSQLGSGHLWEAVNAALGAAGKTSAGEAEWLGLARLAEGSVARALSLLGGSGLALQKRIDDILKGLPRLDVKAVHQLGDEVQGSQNEPRFQLLFDLLLGTLARLVQAEAQGQGAAEDLTLARKIVGASRLASFAELWETLARDRVDALTLNLDRKLLVVQSFARIEAASRA